MFFYLLLNSLVRSESDILSLLFVKSQKKERFDLIDKMDFYFLL